MTDANADFENDEFYEMTEEEAAELDAHQDSAENGENDVLSELEECRAKVNEYLEGWQRARAEFANYKRRVERDQSQYQLNAAGNVIRRYLDILDDLDRALKNRPQEGEGAAWAQGIELIYRKFLNLLEAEGVVAMDSEAQLFDPNLHEAISSEDSPAHESGQIIEVLKQGYLIGDRVLRPALVRVAR